MPILRIKNRHRNKQLKILFASYECAPFYKLGGLGDVAGSLPVALKELGVDIRVIMPYYYKIKEDYPEIKKYKLNIYQSNLPRSRVPVYFLDQPIFRAKNIFDQSERARFITFSLLIKELLDENSLNWRPDIIHCNDWQTALVTKTYKKQKSQKYLGAKTVFTIHNIGYTGRTKLSVLEKFGFTEADFNQIKNGSVNLMRQAILDADLVSTVSPTYAREILTPAYGYDMADALEKRKKDLCGILNGLNVSDWNPKKDKDIIKKFGLEDIGNKYINKNQLQKICGFETVANVPLIAMVSRLAGQKGFDLLKQAFAEIMRLNLQFVILGTGAKEYEDFFRQMNERYKHRFSAHIKFDLKLAHQIYAGADMFLMPSKYEPCGLGQLIAMKYGAIPIVRSTGGLVDTVSRDSGLSFKKYDSSEMFKTIKRALTVYHNQRKWLKLVKNSMKKDFSWATSAKKYLKIYQKLIK